ncbi:IS5 family transposase [Natronococcus sp. JC468]|uniref:IS5 family transposase n=1 Tax=Natronococcus sp. JC468 TaxID=1961921 RepID=UPI0014394A99|nr:IS5 family transposase [Natronococcus sp. JC468]NKE37254.1 IS5 family transposase [Natronococcus sp. JC468]
MTSEFRLFTRESVTKAKNVVENPDEPADPEGGGGFAEWAMLTLQALRIELGKSYRQTIDLLSEMPGILEEIGLTRLPHFTVLRGWFEQISMKTYRAFLGESAEKRTGHAAIDSTGFDRDQPSRHYAQRAHYHVRTLKVTALVDVETLYVTDVHVSTKTPSDFRIGPQVTRRNAGDLLSVAADRGYDDKAFRDELRANGIRPLIKHRIYWALDHAHNARMDRDRYNRRWMVETVFSSLKRTLGSAVRARSWHLEFREMVLKCAVYNLRRTVRYP